MGCLSKYFWELRRARKEYRCSHCGVVIKPGELYVYYFGVGMGTGCRVEWAHYCLSCADLEVKEMLTHNVRKLVGMNQYPASGKRWELPEPWREEILRRLPNIADELKPQQPRVHYGLKYEEKDNVVKVSYSKPGLYQAIACSPNQCTGYYITVDGEYNYVSLSNPSIVQEVRGKLMEIGRVGDNEQTRGEFTKLFNTYFNFGSLVKEKMGWD
ncbi:MAG: hypothetical protein RXN78_03425 [Vulcanisaeta sp.]